MYVNLCLTRDWQRVNVVSNINYIAVIVFYTILFIFSTVAQYRTNDQLTCIQSQDR